MFFVERYTSVTGQYHEKFTPGGKFFMLLAGKKKRKKKKKKKKKGKEKKRKEREKGSERIQFVILTIVGIDGSSQAM